MTADDSPPPADDAATRADPRAGHEVTENARAGTADGSTEIKSHVAPTVRNTDHEADPSFVALLERYRDETPAEHVFAAVESPVDWTDVPQRIGRFSILKRLGQGGYGVVFLAQDPQLHRQVALKVPRPEVLVTASLRERFLREAEAAAALNHANVVPVYEAGSAGPVCYIASAYCPGPDLERWVLEHPVQLDGRQAARWVLLLAEAVQHAHGRGVMHRDVKPSNVLLDPVDGTAADDSDPARWTPRLTDFGLARLANAAVSHTQTGAVLGTPSYMAPEQADGKSHLPGPATDVYGLGAVLYFVLTGKPPFAKATPLDTMQAVVDEEPPRPSRVRRDVPRDLESICLQCLHKSPHRRYSSAADLAADLQRFLDGRPVQARRAGPWERAVRWCRRYPAAATLAATLFLTLVFAAAGMGVLWRQAEGQRQRADQRAADLAAKSIQLQEAIDRLFTTVATSPEIRTVAAEPLRQRLLAEAQRYYAAFVTEQPDDPALREEHARSLLRLAQIHGTLGDLQPSVELARRALDEWMEIRDPSTAAREDRFACGALLAHQLFRTGDFSAARDLYRNLLSGGSPDSKHLDAAGARRLATAWTDLAASELYLADTERAAEAAEHAFALWRQFPPRAEGMLDMQNLLAYARCVRTRGQLLEMRGQYADSERDFATAIGLLEPHADTNNIDRDEVLALLANCHQGLGIAVAQQNRLDEARQHYEQALDALATFIAERPAVPKHREDATGVRYSLAVTQLLLQQYPEAERLIESNLAELESLAREYPDQQLTLQDRRGKELNLLYVIRKRMGDLDGAREAIEAALLCFEQVLQERPDWTETRIAQAETIGNHGNLLSELKRDEEALQQYLQSRRIIAPIHQQQPEHARAERVFFSSYTGPVALHTRREQYSAALQALREWLAVRGEAASAADRLHEVWLLDRRGDFDQALDLLNQHADRFRGTPDEQELADKARQLLEHHEAARATHDDQTGATSAPPRYLDRLRALSAG